jgi:hypothetical protein
MNISEFLAHSEDAFPGAPYTEGQRAAFELKLERFDPKQLVRIWDRVLEICHTRPKIADVYTVANEFGYLRPEDDFKPHRWTSTDCRLCRGEGRLRVVWLEFTQVRNGEAVRMDELERILPYSSDEAASDATKQPGEYAMIARCACPAGDAAGIPKIWPKWKTSIPAVREARR